MDFSERVLRITARIPAGRVSTYGELAKVLGGIKFSRAVGMALSKNQHPVTVPCHRVVRSDGRIGGYSRGAAEKIRLLVKEGISMGDGRVCNLRDKLLTAAQLRSL